MNRRNFLQTALAAAVLGGATSGSATVTGGGESAEADNPNPTGVNLAGIQMIPVCGGKYNVWTKRIGSGRVKVLLLHGGPGIPHDYLEAMEAFLPQAGIQMYYYDQLGVGNSDVPNDPSLWTLSRYTEEVEEVRQGLNLDQFVLFGHSWGGMLAIEYALRYQKHLSGLVISNMTAGMHSYLKYNTLLKDRLLSSALRAEINTLEAKKDYDNPRYEEIVVRTLYPQMLCRLKPWPEPLNRSTRLANWKIYNQMQGKSEFEVTGTLKDWERWDQLHKIEVKALTIGATYDEMDPEDLRKMAMLMPRGQNSTCPKGSHMALWDDQAYYFDYLLTFLKSL